MLHFLPTEGETLHPQKDYDLLYCNAALLQWSGLRPATSLRYTCNVFFLYFSWDYKKLMVRILDVMFKTKIKELNKTPLM